MVRQSAAHPADNQIDPSLDATRRQLARKLRDPSLSVRDRWMMSQLALFFGGRAPEPPHKDS
jgi:hypothetical protein